MIQGLLLTIKVAYLFFEILEKLSEFIAITVFCDQFWHVLAKPLLIPSPISEVDFCTSNRTVTL